MIKRVATGLLWVVVMVILIVGILIGISVLLIISLFNYIIFGIDDEDIILNIKVITDKWKRVI